MSRFRVRPLLLLAAAIVPGAHTRAQDAAPQPEWSPSAVQQSRELRDFDRSFGRPTHEPQPPGDPVPIYYPPNPPPLDGPIAVTADRAGRLAPPPDLAPYVNEVFYPALGSRLYTKTLHADSRRDFENYRARKTELQRALRVVLDDHWPSEPEARRQALEAFARRQAPAIAALEKTAETLRRAVATWNMNWTARRQWHLADKEKRGFSPGEIAAVMRGYAYYHESLSPDQRRLLREIAMELMAAVDETAPSDDEPHFFFSPETARIALPESVPPALAEKVAAYRARKSELKKELYDAIHAQDGAAFGFLRQPLKSLAGRQAPEFAALDVLAEEIRRDLPPAPGLQGATDRSPFSSDLLGRIAIIVRERANARGDAAFEAEAILDRARGIEAHQEIAYRFDEDGMIVTRLPRGGRPLEPVENETVAATQAALGRVAEKYGRRLVALLNEQEGVRNEAALALGSTERDVVERMLVAAREALRREENQDAYRDYRIAVLEPGLSPGQRRLLFDRAIEKLELPLPHGELQPSVRAKTW